MEQFVKYVRAELRRDAPVEERLRGIPPEEILSRIPPEAILAHLRTLQLGRKRKPLARESGKGATKRRKRQ
jgi:hypothetical protein